PDGTRILVVEDEESLADSVRYNLEREGYSVSVAADGRRALERFRNDPPSLVILDLMLPEVSGLAVCRTIPSHSDVPIIMVTAKGSEGGKGRGARVWGRRPPPKAVLDARAGLARSGQPASDPTPRDP